MEDESRERRKEGGWGPKSKIQAKREVFAYKAKLIEASGMTSCNELESLIQNFQERRAIHIAPEHCDHHTTDHELYTNMAGLSYINSYVNATHSNKLAIASNCKIKESPILDYPIKHPL